MNVSASMTAPCDGAQLFPWIEDLSLYPEWLTIVPVAVRADPMAGDAGPAWSVDLRGRLGPLARSKRLRMVRTLHDVPHRVVFERHEQDGRDHSAWVLSAEVTAGEGESAGESTLTMDLHYGGRFGGRTLERLLREEIDRSRPALRQLVEQPR